MGESCFECDLSLKALFTFVISGNSFDGEVTLFVVVSFAFSICETLESNIKLKVIKSFNIKRRT